jgi:hypothetical protein
MVTWTFILLVRFAIGIVAIVLAILAVTAARQAGVLAWRSASAPRDTTPRPRLNAR